MPLSLHRVAPGGVTIGTLVLDGGSVVEIDPETCAAEIEAGLLVPVKPEPTEPTRAEKPRVSLSDAVAAGAGK